MRSSSEEFSRGSYHHHHHHHQIHQKTIFLPMLCRVSTKDMNFNHNRNQSSAADPSSPKVSCIGQVKRNNRVISFPTTYRFAAATTSSTVNHHHHHNNKYTKLRKLFSSKTLMPATTSTATVAASTGRRSCRSSREVCSVDSRKLKIKDQSSVKEVNLEELDPPLPVVKRVQPPSAAAGGGRDEVNLWKRRFGGPEIKSLQIEQIQLQNNKFLPPTTV